MVFALEAENIGKVYGKKVVLYNFSRVNIYIPKQAFGCGC